MRKLKSLSTFKNEAVNSLGLEKVTGGLAMISSAEDSLREEGVTTGQSPQNGLCDSGFKLDGTFNQYPGEKGWVKC
jgi:hypothetical protein